MTGLPLLVTPPGSELALPPELGLPAGSTWRLMESLGTCLFVALASADTFASPEPRTLVLCWDSDLVNFLESSKMATVGIPCRPCNTSRAGSPTPAGR